VILAFVTHYNYWCSNYLPAAQRPISAPGTTSIVCILMAVFRTWITCKPALHDKLERHHGNCNIYTVSECIAAKKLYKLSDTACIPIKNMVTEGMIGRGLIAKHLRLSIYKQTNKSYGQDEKNIISILCSIQSFPRQFVTSALYIRSMQEGVHGNIINSLKC
jgi:hypothetical protein